MAKYAWTQSGREIRHADPKRDGLEWAAARRSQTTAATSNSRKTTNRSNGRASSKKE